MAYLHLTNEDGNGIYNSKVTLISDKEAKAKIAELEKGDQFEEDNGVYYYSGDAENMNGTLVPLDTMKYSEHVVIPVEAIKKMVDHSYDDERDHYLDIDNENKGHIFLSIDKVKKWLNAIK